MMMKPFVSPPDSFSGRPGFDCETAADAMLAKQRIAAEEFDLLIADLNMPGNSGLELVQASPNCASDCRSSF
jgi:DNA-binding response OmpR family regulator